MERRVRFARRRTPRRCRTQRSRSRPAAWAPGLPFDADSGESARAGRRPARKKAAGGRRAGSRLQDHYFRCELTSLVISNMDTCFLPPKTAFNLSSALIIRLLMASCSLFFLM